MSHNVYAIHDADGKITRKVVSAPEYVAVLPFRGEVAAVETDVEFLPDTHKVVDGQVVPK